MCRRTVATRKMGRKMEPAWANIQKPKPSPKRNGKEKRVVINALPARRVFEAGAVKAVFQEDAVPMTRPAQAKLQIDSQKERKTVTKRLRVDCAADMPKSMSTLRTMAGIEKRLLVKK